MARDPKVSLAKHNDMVKAILADRTGRSLRIMLMTSDSAPGIVKAIEVCFPRAARQRSLAHRMRNLASKVPEEVWPEFKGRVQVAYQAPCRVIAYACRRHCDRLRRGA